MKAPDEVFFEHITEVIQLLKEINGVLDLTHVEWAINSLESEKKKLEKQIVYRQLGGR